MNTFLDSKIYIAPLFIVTLNLLVSGCGFGPRESFNAETSKVDMIIYFLPNTPSDEKDEIWVEVLNVPSDKGGYDFAEGIVGVFGCESPKGKASICVDFAKGIPLEKRENIRIKVEKWPTVLRVLEDVVPMQVTEADLLN